MAKESGEYYSFSPIVTSIGFVKSVTEKVQLKTVLPFHFVTKEAIDPEKKIKDQERCNYRCAVAEDETHLIWRTVEQAVAEIENVEQAKKVMAERLLIKLGMLLHTFSDTYAHYGFSGLNGWENWAKASKVTHVTAEGNKEEHYYAPASLLPEIGHACLAHLPDAAGYCSI